LTNSKSGVWVWLATYDGRVDRVRQFGEEADRLLKRLFPGG